ncbi:MAG: formate dehydrogenase accessory sulfurtransferase FdhD [Acidimicrobiia bacterium]|nr:formate dehydrogenase accessory sulfurtransferase FdhD [Acidimicrobiia bacterium]
MARQRTDSVLVVKFADESSRRTPDRLVVEEPMSIRLDGELVATTMRTPGNDFELAVGFCFADGLLNGVPVTGVRYCADVSAVESAFNVVTVETGGRAPTPTPRLGNTTSSCGLCGSQTLDELVQRLSPLDNGRLPDFPISTITTVPTVVAAEQPLFTDTGAVHAAAVFTIDGRIELVREDVGRHNAVDKVVGRLLLDGQLPAHEWGLFVSGRASFEMVQKAWAAGFGTVVSVSAPTALAVQTAKRAGITLYGFVRDGRAVRYSPG